MKDGVSNFNLQNIPAPLFIFVRHQMCGHIIARGHSYFRFADAQLYFGSCDLLLFLTV